MLKMKFPEFAIRVFSVRLALLMSWVLTAILASGVRADEEAPFEKIAYSNRIPTFVKSAMPRGAKTAFYGSIVPSGTKKRFLFHVYALWPAEFLPENRRGLLKTNFVLDIFESSKQTLINRASLYYFLGSSDFPLVEMKFYWLDFKKKTVPMLVVRFFSKGGYGPIGDEHFLGFSKGFAHSFRINSLTFGEWFSSDTIGQKNAVVLGSEDLLEIHTRVYPASDSGPLRVDWLWIGQFIPSASTRDAAIRNFGFPN